MLRKKTTSSAPINKLLFLSAFVLTLTPLPARAAVMITEVMYDLPGSDSGREWVEVTNFGAEPVDLKKFKFAEGSANHTLAVAKGSSVLLPGASAILADNVEKFIADWPGFAGTIFNTAFALSNAGETLSLKNASSSVEDTITYEGGGGAGGDGGTLNRHGNPPIGGLVAALPSPGVYPGPLTPVPVVVKATPTPKTSKTSSKTKTTKAPSSSQVAAVAAPENTFDIADQKTTPVIPLSLWIVGLVALIGLGVTGVIFARLNHGKVPMVGETNSKKEEFEIIET
jgi:hypothetical protein